MNYIDGQICPICGQGTLRLNKILETYRYKNYDFDIPNYEVFHCGHCKEGLLSEDFIQKTSPLIKQFQKLIDGMTKNFKDRLCDIADGKYRKLIETFDINDECEHCHEFKGEWYLQPKKKCCSFPSCFSTTLNSNLILYLRENVKNI